MNILFTICGRAGSKGIKGKNHRSFLGYPLPLYTLSAIDLYLTGHPDVTYDIVLNTDSNDLRTIMEDSNLRDITFIRRKPELAGDTVGKMDVIRDCFSEMIRRGRSYDMVIDLDITSPLRTVSDLEQAVQSDMDRYDVVFSVVESRRNPFFNMVRQKDGYYTRVIETSFTTRQEAPAIFDMNASIYVYRPVFLRDHSSIFEGKCGIIQMDDTGVLDLDREDDIKLMEVVAEYLYSTDERYGEIRDNMISKIGELDRC